MARFAIERYKGFADALENSGIKLEKKYIYKISSMTAYDTAFAVASNFLKSPNHPDAILPHQMLSEPLSFKPLTSSILWSLTSLLLWDLITPCSVESVLLR